MRRGRRRRDGRPHHNERSVRRRNDERQITKRPVLVVRRSGATDARVLSRTPRRGILHAASWDSASRWQLGPLLRDTQRAHQPSCAVARERCLWPGLVRCAGIPAREQVVRRVATGRGRGAGLVRGSRRRSTATRAQIVAAYWARAKVAHSDAGGSHEAMTALVRASDEALTAVTSR
jgi:hypothetical protein